jgi:hypothetical protein
MTIVYLFYLNDGGRKRMYEIEDPKLTRGLDYT